MIVAAAFLLVCASCQKAPVKPPTYYWPTQQSQHHYRTRTRAPLSITEKRKLREIEQDVRRLHEQLNEAIGRTEAPPDDE